MSGRKEEIGKEVEVISSNWVTKVKWQLETGPEKEILLWSWVGENYAPKEKG